MKSLLNLKMNKTAYCGWSCGLDQIDKICVHLETLLPLSPVDTYNAGKFVTEKIESFLVVKLSVKCIPYHVPPPSPPPLFCNSKMSMHL